MPSCAAESCGKRRRWWQGADVGVTLDGAGCARRAASSAWRGPGSAIRRQAPPRPAGRPPLRLGALLRHHRACRPEQIDEALAAQAESHLRLGEQLRAMGAVQGPAVLRALAAQAGVELPGVGRRRARARRARRAVARRRTRPGRGAARPPDGGRMRVAFPAPVPRAALTAFRVQTGWTPEPFLVGDDEWLVLLRHYGAGREAHGAGTPRTVPPVARRRRRGAHASPPR